NNFTESSTASAVMTTVGKAATSTALAAAPSPATVGTPLTFTATPTVTAPGAGTPAGPGTFFDGATRLGTGQLGLAGGTLQATFGTSTLAVGRHSITANYGRQGAFYTTPMR